MADCGATLTAFFVDFQEWADELFRCATNLLALNRCPLSFLEKCYTKLCLVTSAEGMIPVKKYVGHSDKVQH